MSEAIIADFAFDAATIGASAGGIRKPVLPAKGRRTQEPGSRLTVLFMLYHCPSAYSLK